MLTSFPGCDDDCTSYHLWLVTGTGLLLTTTLKRTTLHEVRRALLTLLSWAQLSHVYLAPSVLVTRTGWSLRSGMWHYIR